MNAIILYFINSQVFTLYVIKNFFGITYKSTTHIFKVLEKINLA